MNTRHHGTALVRLQLIAASSCLRPPYLRSPADRFSAVNDRRRRQQPRQPRRSAARQSLNPPTPTKLLFLYFLFSAVPCFANTVRWRTRHTQDDEDHQLPPLSTRAHRREHQDGHTMATRCHSRCCNAVPARRDLSCPRALPSRLSRRLRSTMAGTEPPIGMLAIPPATTNLHD